MANSTCARVQICWNRDEDLDIRTFGRGGYSEIMKFEKKTQVFFALLEAGLWEKNVRLSRFGNVDYNEVYRLAEEQSVVGLVAAGLEHVTDVKVPKEELLQFVGQALQLEQRNKVMNTFLSSLIEKLRGTDIHTLLLKGQGVAQSYERPLWRTSGDIDLFLSEGNYLRAKDLLVPLAGSVEDENNYTQHFGMTINSIEVELHGNLRSELYPRIDRELDKVKDEIFYAGDVRSWLNGKTQVFLPSINCDIVYVFTHILQHFFKGGIGLRQICDWCRLLWTYRDSLNHGLLESRIKNMGLMSEWKTFGSLAVNTLGMPAEAMPFYSDSNKWKKKAERVLAFVLETGNFGHNRDMSYRNEESAISRKWKTFCHITSDTIKQFTIFPMDSLKVWWGMMRGGVLTLVGK